MKYKYYIETREDGSLLEAYQKSICWRKENRGIIELYLRNKWVKAVTGGSRLEGFLYEVGYTETTFREVTEDEFFVEML